MSWFDEAVNAFKGMVGKVQPAHISFKETGIIPPHAS